MPSLRIGVLALQGAFAEHVAMLRRLDGEMRHDAAPVRSADDDRAVEAVEVRLPAQLADVDALIIPGGESTTIGKLLVEYDLLDPLRRRIAAGLPVLGTCAGAIVLASGIARDVGGLDQPLVGAMDLTVRRNAFGRQLQSFETDLIVPALGDRPIHAIFIRAPAIVDAGPAVDVLARLPDETIVAARQGNLVVTAFHPELTDDTRLHRYFVRLVGAALIATGRGAREAAAGSTR